MCLVGQKGRDRKWVRQLINCEHLHLVVVIHREHVHHRRKLIPRPQRHSCSPAYGLRRLLAVFSNKGEPSGRVERTFEETWVRELGWCCL